ncbi:MAG: C-terminal binding protein [Thermodesulfobacteriota bacterium]
MTFNVVNTIQLPGVDIGGKLLQGVDAVFVEKPGRTEAEIIAAAADADAVICSGPVQPWTSQVIAALNQCRIIASLGVGYDRIDLDKATEKGIAVTNIPDYCIDEVSTQTIALMLSLGRRLFMVDDMVRKQHVNFVPPNRKALAGGIRPVFRLNEQTLGVLGFGKIGTATALKAKGLGMRVIACDPYVYTPIMQSHGVMAVDFDTLLEQSDYICINAALTPETMGLFDKAAFNMMKPTAYIINTARGEIVNEPDLVAALKTGRIAGAGLDVTASDPIPEDDPLLDLPNVILTGHSAWYSETSDSEGHFWHRAMDQVVKALRGDWPEYTVNPEVRNLWMEKWGE